MTEIKLTRNQIEELNKIAKHFKEIDLFTIKSESTSGIGPTVRVSFTLWGGVENTNVDITDFSSW